jgi:hypothetical protein
VTRPYRAMSVRASEYLGHKKLGRSRLARARASENPLAWATFKVTVNARSVRGHALALAVLHKSPLLSRSHVYGLQNPVSRAHTLRADLCDPTLLPACLSPTPGGGMLRGQALEICYGSSR